MSRLDASVLAEIGNLLVNSEFSGNIDEWSLDIFVTNILALFIQSSDFVIGGGLQNLNGNGLFSPFVGARRTMVPELDEV